MAKRYLILLAVLASLHGCAQDTGDESEDTGEEALSETEAPEEDSGSGPPLFSDAELQAQGCDLDRPADAYAAGASSSRTLDRPNGQGDAPVPCLSLTGYGTASTTIGISGDGETIFFAQAFSPEGYGIVRSRDRGESWQFLLPTYSDGSTPRRMQSVLHLDPDTDRVFFTSSRLIMNPDIAQMTLDGGYEMAWSADQGESWSHVAIENDTHDWPKILSGPPASSQPMGYPNVVYFSAPYQIAGNWIIMGPQYQSIYKSLDGGKSWQEAGRIPLVPAEIEGCVPNEFVLVGNGAVARDGTVYLGFRKCLKLAVAVSRDEGATWTTHDIPGAALRPYDQSSIASLLQIVGNESAIVGEPLAVDSEGNLYIVWNDADRTLRLAVSRDGGESWSEPVAIMAPGVDAVRFAAVAVKEPGTIAVAYYGSTDGGLTYNGYLAESSDALGAEPTFWSATVNDPADPLFSYGFESGYSLYYFNTGDGHEFVQVKYSPDGDVWGAFVRNMCPGGPDAGGCTWDLDAHVGSMFQGAVGRLAHR